MTHRDLHVENHSASQINSEARNKTDRAELGKPSDLKQVHAELHKDQQSYSASDYGKLLNGVQQKIADDIKANAKLPKIDLFDSTKSGLPDAAKPNFGDGQQRSPRPTRSGDGDSIQPPFEPPSGATQPSKGSERPPVAPPPSSTPHDGNTKPPAQGPGTV